MNPNASPFPSESPQSPSDLCVSPFPVPPSPEWADLAGLVGDNTPRSPDWSVLEAPHHEQSSAAGGANTPRSPDWSLLATPPRTRASTPVGRHVADGENTMSGENQGHWSPGGEYRANARIGSPNPLPMLSPPEGSWPVDAAQRTVTELEVSPPPNSDMMDAPRRRVAELKVTKHGMPPKPGMVDALEGLVAARGFSEVSVITTPNATWVPKFAVAHSEITTYMDGRWGLHEYSRWPQAFSRELWYIHCIPAHPRPLGPGPVCFRTLQRSDWRADDCGITNIGFLEIILQVELLSEARIAISQYERVDKNGSAWATTGDFLAVSLRHVSDRLRTVPAAPSIVICLAAHVQRLTLELYGMVEWLSVVMDCVRTSRDHRTDVPDVLGAHTSNPTEAQRLHWIGMPVWLEREISERVDVYQIVEAADVPSDFSRIPCVPRLVLAKRDMSGALNMPGEWERAMAAVVSRQLCTQDLPSLLDEEARGTLPPAKRLREGAAFLGEYSSSVGPVNPTFVVKNRRDIQTLGHILPPAPPVSTSQSAEHQSRRAKARAAKRAISGLSQTGSSGALSSTPVPFKLEPSRQFYPSHNVIVDDLWATAMAQASGCPQPRASVNL